MTDQTQYCQSGASGWYERRIADLDSSFDTLEAVWGDGVGGWTFDKLQVSQSRKVKTEVLQRIRRLVYEQDVYDHLSDHAPLGGT